MPEETVVTVTGGGEILKTFVVPTAQIKKKDVQEIQLLAGKYNQVATFHSIPGFTGIEAVKWEIKKMNGDE